MIGINTPLRFGLYCGYTIRNIFSGSSVIKHEFIELYIKNRLPIGNALSLKEGDYGYFNKYDGLVLNEVIVLANQRLIINWSSTQNQLSGDEISDFINGYLELSPDQHFSVNSLIIKSNHGILNNKVETQLDIIANPEYIEKLILHDEEFVIEKESFFELFNCPCYFFDGVSISYACDNIFSYEIKSHIFAYKDNNGMYHRDFHMLNDYNRYKTANMLGFKYEPSSLDDFYSYQYFLNRHKNVQFEERRIDKSSCPVCDGGGVCLASDSDLCPFN